MGCQHKHPPHITFGSLLYTQSQNTAVQCGLDPATQISSTPNFIVQCNPRSSHDCQCSAKLHLLLYVVKWQLTICYKSSKPIHIALCMLMSLSIHLHGLIIHDICRHNYAVERGLVVRLCGQPHYCYRPYYPTGRFRSPSSYMVSDEPFPDIQMRSRPVTFL